MTVRTTETERKYEAGSGTRLPAFEQLAQVASVRDAPAEQMEAEYYDTGDLRLIRAGITLRRRLGGHDEGWHLKLPAGADSRREIRVPLGRGRAVPEALAQLIRVHSRGRELRPIATITTGRQRLLLVDASGAELAEVASDEVTARATVEAGAARVTQWSEVEIELTGGGRDLLTAADRLLLAAGLSRSAARAKLERAIGLPGEAAVPAGGALSASAPAGQVATAYLRTQYAALIALDPMVRAQEPDSVHQMRVAVRRSRSTLQTFGSLYPSAEAEPLASELRWLGQVLGQARDAEVLAAHLASRADALPAAGLIGPVAARIAGHYAQVRAAGQSGVAETLDSARYFALLDRMETFVLAPPLTKLGARRAGAVLPAAVRESYAKTRRRIRQAERAPAGYRRDQALHRARRSAKRTRYAAELVSAVRGQAGPLASQMKRVQTVLGDHQDAVLARQAWRELGLAAHQAGENAFSYGLLFEREDQAAAKLRRKARRTWRAASKKKYRRWLG